MGTPGITIIDKQKYLSNIKDGIFGGLPRKMTIESIDNNETIAMVKLRMESSENYFVSYNSLVLDIDNEWKLINILAVVEAKKQRNKSDEKKQPAPQSVLLKNKFLVNAAQMSLTLRSIHNKYIGKQWRLCIRLSQRSRYVTKKRGLKSPLQ